MYEVAMMPTKTVRRRTSGLGRGCKRLGEYITDEQCAAVMRFKQEHNLSDRQLGILLGCTRDVVYHAIHGESTMSPAFAAKIMRLCNGEIEPPVEETSDLPFEAANERRVLTEYRHIGRIMQMWIEIVPPFTPAALTDALGVDAKTALDYLRDKQPVPRAVLFKFMEFVGATSIEIFMGIDQ